MTEVEITPPSTAPQPALTPPPAPEVPKGAVLASPVLCCGTDEEKLSAMNMWTGIVGQIRQLKNIAREDLEKVIASLEGELCSLRNECCPPPPPPTPNVAAPVPTPELSVATAINQAYESLSLTEQLQRLAGIWPGKK